MPRRTTQTLAFLLLLTASVQAQTFTAKVVGVSDGDTITVYDGSERTKIRVEGMKQDPRCISLFT